jgi:hypothetical protein
MGRSVYLPNGYLVPEECVTRMNANSHPGRLPQSLIDRFTGDVRAQLQRFNDQQGQTDSRDQMTSTLQSLGLDPALLDTASDALLAAIIELVRKTTAGNAAATGGNGNGGNGGSLSQFRDGNSAGRSGSSGMSDRAIRTLSGSLTGRAALRKKGINPVG